MLYELAIKQLCPGLMCRHGWIGNHLQDRIGICMSNMIEARVLDGFCSFRRLSEVTKPPVFESGRGYWITNAYFGCSELYARS